MINYEINNVNISIKKTKISACVMFLLIVLNYIVISDEIGFIFVLLIDVVLFLRIHTKVFIPGYVFLVLYLLQGIIMGVVSDYPLWNVLRDTFYVFNPLSKIFLGYYLGYIFGEKKSIYKTIVVYCAVVSIVDTCWRIFTGYDISNFYGGSVATTLRFILPILIMENTWGIVGIENKNVNLFLKFLFAFNIIVGLKRTAYLIVAVNFVLLILFLPKKKKLRYSTTLKIMGIIIVAVILAYSIIGTLPENVVDQFIGKWENATEEIGTIQEGWSSSDVAQNWRSYEVSLAIENFKSGTFIQQLIGYGFGKIIETPYAYMVGTASDGGITILHNGFYTILVKGGILGIICIILFYLKGFLFCINNIRNNKNIQQNVILSILYATMIIKTWLTMGLFRPDIELTWCLMFGWLYADIKRECNKGII